MKTLTFGLAALALVAGLAAAHQENYVQPNPGAGVSLAGIRTCPGEGEPTPEEPLYDTLGFTIGGIKYCGGHIAPDGAGDNQVSLSDDLVSPVSATYCQDLNNDARCGADNDIPPDGLRDEPRANFCGSIVLDSPIDLTSRAEWPSANWDPDVAVLFFVHAPGTGNAAVSPCGTLYSGATTGSGNHL